MKTLYLCRHAKSSWADPGMDDFDRPLNDRGLRNAPFMANVFKERGERIDLIVSSPALRAKTTAEAFVEALSLSPQAYMHERAIYLADVRSLLQIIGELPDKADHVMLFGHNPGYTQLVDDLCDAGIGNLPTCGLVRIDFTVDDWQHIAKGSGTFVWFDYPKRHPGQG